MSVAVIASYGDAVAAEVRAWMGRRGIRGRGLAELIGKDEIWVSRRVNGKVRMTIDDLALIAQGLDVSISDLLPPVPPGGSPFPGASGTREYPLLLAAA